MIYIQLCAHLWIYIVILFVKFILWKFLWMFNEVEVEQNVEVTCSSWRAVIIIRGYYGVF